MPPSGPFTTSFRTRRCSAPACSAAAVAIVSVLTLLALTGCKDRAKEISRPEYLLTKQHEIWAQARESVHSDRPNLDIFRYVHRFLCYRTPRRVEKAYDGRDKQELLARLRAVGQAYEKHVHAMLDLTGGRVGLVRGATIEQLRQAFDKVDEEYRRLEAMTAGG